MDEDVHKLRECLDGSLDALAFLRNKYQSLLTTALLRRGASPTEAEDLLADLWGDCVARNADHPSLLEKWGDRCPVKAWLVTVATNRLFDVKRKLRFRGVVTGNDTDATLVNPFQDAATALTSLKDTALTDLLKESLERAFDRCSAGGLLMLRLVYLHGVTQREVGRMWGWHESKVSRSLTQAMLEIEAHTLRGIREADPWMELTWEDFLELCETHRVGFL